MKTVENIFLIVLLAATTAVLLIQVNAIGHEMGFRLGIEGLRAAPVEQSKPVEI